MVLLINRSLLVCLLLAAPAQADPDPPSHAVSVNIQQLGVICKPTNFDLLDAPQTQGGSVKTYDGAPVFVAKGQKVPALAGISFGVQFTVSHDVAKLRYMISLPDWNRRDIWEISTTADRINHQGYSEGPEAPPEPGIYLLEAWDGDTQLYAVEFEVVPAAQMPGINSVCDLVS
jgi:hypothetical protein